jgi:hypothetical protein
MKMNEVLLLHAARPLTGLRTREAIGTTAWTVIPQSPFLPNLAHSDLHLFGPPKKHALRGRCFWPPEKACTQRTLFLAP